MGPNDIKEAMSKRHFWADAHGDICGCYKKRLILPDGTECFMVIYEEGSGKLPTSWQSIVCVKHYDLEGKPLHYTSLDYTCFLYEVIVNYSPEE